MRSLVEQVNAISLEAGQRIREGVRKNQWQVKIKPDRTLVTCIDQMANDFICEALTQLEPSLPIVAEESLVSVDSSTRDFWLVDPLDGTRGFVDGSSEYSINISLIQQGCPVLGVMYAPAFDDLFYAAEHVGTFRRFQQQESEAIQARSRLEPWRFVFSRYASLVNILPFFEGHCHPRPLHLNSALKFSSLVLGMADVYLRVGPTSLWDTAAGQCILEQAGGILVDLSGEKLQYTLGGSLLNPAFLAVNDVSLVPELLSLYQQWRKSLDENS